MDDAVADPVRKIFRVRVVADVHERQDGNRVYRLAAAREICEIDNSHYSYQQRGEAKRHSALVGFDLADQVSGARYG